MPSAYVIANVEVTNPEQYEEYKKLSTIAMKAHGAEVCIRGGKVEDLQPAARVGHIGVMSLVGNAAAGIWRFVRAEQ